MKYSIIIPYHSNKMLLYLCVNTLLKTIPEDVEVIVVANNNNPEELEIKLPGCCTLLKFNDSMYYPRAVNLGVSAAHGEYVVLMDADICVRPGWLEGLSTIFDIYPNVGGCSAKMLDPFDGCVKEFGIAYTGYNFPHPFAGRSEDNDLVLQDREVQAFCSAASMYRRDTFLAVGGMNENLVDGYSDIDLCLRLRSAGFHTYVAAGAVVYHHGSSTHGSGMSFSLRADTKGFFMAHGGGCCQVDIDRYYKLAFQTYKKPLEPTYFLIDFTTIADYRRHYNIFTDIGGFQFTDTYRQPAQHRDAAHIPLYTWLDDNIRRHPQPICYFVDDFRTLRNNKVWSELRPYAADIVIDRNANLLSFGEIV